MLDVVCAGAVEQPHAISEQDGRDADEDLVKHTRVETSLGDVGPEDVDAPVARGGLGRGDAPMLPISSSTVGLGPRCSVNQDMSPPGPAINPSNDMVTEYNILPMTANRPSRSRTLCPGAGSLSASTG